jgi:hypothetical protein
MLRHWLLAPCHSGHCVPEPHHPLPRAPPALLIFAQLVKQIAPYPSHRLKSVVSFFVVAPYCGRFRLVCANGGCLSEARARMIDVRYYVAKELVIYLGCALVFTRLTENFVPREVPSDVPNYSPRPSSLPHHTVHEAPTIFSRLFCL